MQVNKYSASLAVMAYRARLCLSGQVASFNALALVPIDKKVDPQRPMRDAYALNR